MNKSYCALPFREIMFTPGDTLLLCCRHDTNVVIDGSFEDSYKKGKIQEIRNLMLSGEIVEGCEQCYVEEDQGVKSMRQQSIEKYGVVTDISLESLHIQFDNVCNLKCRMCTSTSSHLLYNEEKELLGETVSFKKHLTSDSYNQIDVSKLTEIKLHGGEPFLSKRVENFFRDLIEKDIIQNISVMTPTNGTVRLNDTLSEAFLKCKKLSISFSIDGVGKLNDYIRNKSDFDEIINNIEYFNELLNSRPAGSTTLEIVTSVSVYNVNKLKDIDNFFKNKFPNITLKKSFVNGPKFLNISCLPSEYKEIIKDQIKDYPDVMLMINVDNNHLLNEFIFQNDQWDSYRKESLQTVNPELFNFIQNFKKEKNIQKEDILKFYNLWER